MDNYCPPTISQSPNLNSIGNMLINCHEDISDLMNPLTYMSFEGDNYGINCVQRSNPS